MDRVHRAFGDDNFSDLVPQPPEADMPIDPTRENAMIEEGQDVLVNPADNDAQPHRRALEAHRGNSGSIRTPTMPRSTHWCSTGCSTTTRSRANSYSSSSPVSSPTRCAPTCKTGLAGNPPWSAGNAARSAHRPVNQDKPLWERRQALPAPFPPRPGARFRPAARGHEDCAGNLRGHPVRVPLRHRPGSTHGRTPEAPGSAELAAGADAG